MRAVVLVAVFPRAKARLPQRCVDHIRMRGIDEHIGAAGVCILVEHLYPVLPAVGGAVDATLLVGAVGMTEHRGKKAVGVVRVNDQRRNLLAITEAEMLPRLTRIA